MKILYICIIYLGWYILIRIIDFEKVIFDKFVLSFRYIQNYPNHLQNGNTRTTFRCNVWWLPYRRVGDKLSHPLVCKFHNRAWWKGAGYMYKHNGIALGINQAASPFPLPPRCLFQADRAVAHFCPDLKVIPRRWRAAPGGKGVRPPPPPSRFSPFAKFYGRSLRKRGVAWLERASWKSSPHRMACWHIDIYSKV